MGPTLNKLRAIQSVLADSEPISSDVQANLAAKLEEAIGELSRGPRPADGPPNEPPTGG